MKKFLQEILSNAASLRVMVFYNDGDKSQNTILGELVACDEIGVVLKSSKEEFSKVNPPILIPFTSILKIEVRGGNLN